MRVVKGVYENGVITLTELAPLKEKQEVMVLIPEDGETEVPEALRFAGMLLDLSPDELVAFEEAIRRKVRFARKVQL